MADLSESSDYLLLSRGQWDPEKSNEEIQSAIDDVYDWYEHLVAQGKFKPGHRLATGTKLVARTGITDGPFAEAKELIGGCAIMQAASLAEAKALVQRMIDVHAEAGVFDVDVEIRQLAAEGGCGGQPQ